MKHLLGKGIGKGDGIGMGMGEGTRPVRFEDFINYIQKNYRANLNERDYEILTEISNKYSSKEILKALMYCKDKKVDSLFYLQDALVKKYYQTQAEVPSWFIEEIKPEPLDEADKEWCKSFYKKYCNTEEEYLIRIKEVGLVE